MSQTERFLGEVAWRLAAERLLRGLALCLCAAAALSSALVLAERLLGLGAPAAALAAGPLVAAGVLGLAYGLNRWPGRRACALEADARFRLEERVSSALDPGAGPMADLVCADAERHIQGIDLRRELPVRLPRSAQGLALLLPALAIVLCIPPLDVLGLARGRAERAASADALRDAAGAASRELKSLAETARGGSDGGAGEAIERIRQRVEPLAKPGVNAAKAREDVKQAELELKKAEDENLARQRLEAGNRERLRQAELARDALFKASRALHRLAKALPGSTAAGAAEIAKGQGGPPPVPTAGPLVRVPEQAAKPETIVAPQARLLEVRPRIESALAREGTAWAYRAVVQRYFSPEE